MIVSTRERVLGRVLIIVFMLVTIVPFVSLFITALHEPGTYPNGLSLPERPHWENFLLAFQSANMPALLWSSVLIELGVVPIAVLIATLAGFALGHLKPAGGRIVFVVFILGLTLPFEGIIVPLYYQIRDMGLLNTRWAIILPLIGLFMPFAVTWMRAHFIYDDLPAVARWASDAGFAVAAVDYRLAPEHPYPAAVEDVYTGFVWLAGEADALGLDPQRIVVGGVSAGGGLAAAVTLLSRDRRGPVPAGQMLLCPMLDDRNDSASALQMAGIGAWDRGANATAWRAYLAGVDPVPAYAAPARADDLSGLPPTFIDVGSAETFRDEDVDYARRIWAAGGDAELHVWPGGAHGFDALVPEAQLSLASLRARTDWLRRLLARLG